MKASELAKYILNESKKDLSNLELQKTLYFTELDYFKKFKKHLIEDDFQAWKFGPVADEVYWKYRNYGANSINRPDDISEISKKLNDEEKKIINKSIQDCNKKTYWALVEESHKDGGAWKKTYEENEKKIIDKKLIEEEAEKL